MAMPYTTDFDQVFTELVYAPAQVTEIYPPQNALYASSEDQQIKDVCSRYIVWMLDFAETLSKMDNSGFAVLAILNSYFDAIAQFHGHAQSSIREGILLVFPELKGAPYGEKAIRHLVKYLRNPMAHMGATGRDVILAGYYEHPLMWGLFHGTVAVTINPRLWAAHIREHFNRYMAQLEDTKTPDGKHLRQMFIARISREP